MEETNPKYDEIRSLISQGRFLEGFTQCRKLLAESNSDDTINQLYALSLSKTGSPMAAAKFLEPIYMDNMSDPETSGILGGIYKDIFRRTKDSKYAVLSRDTYLINFKETNNYYPGINAATMSAIMGQMRKGREIAGQVIEQIDPETQDFWTLATLGEAHLLTKNFQDARKYYLAARRKAGRNWGTLISAYNQLWLLSHYMAYPSEILKLFEPPTIVAFVGHMIDKPDRSVPRFPIEIADPVKQAIATEIKILNAGIGYSSLACGGDILFAEAMLEAGGEMNVILPFADSDFLETSVAFAGEDWAQRFHAIMEKSRIKYITKEKYLGNDDLFSFQGKAIFGTAVLRGFRFNKKPHLLTVLSGLDQQVKEGGTRHMLAQWPYKSNYINIDPDNFPKPLPEEAKETDSPKEFSAGSSNRRVLYLASAAIPEASSKEVDKLIRRVWMQIRDFFIRPLVFQNEGNRVIAAFTSSRSSMDFANLIPDLVKKELPNYDFFLGLHAGPVYVEEKTSYGYKNVSGDHVEIARTIERNAIPFEVFSSEAFASNLAIDEENYNIEFVGALDPDNSNISQDIYKLEKQ